MKKIIILLVLMFTAGSIFAKEQNEVGVILGGPTGFSGKFFTSNINAIDVVVGFNDGFMMHADYLWHDFKALKVEEGKFPLYYGAGVLVGEDRFCVQGKIGIEYLFATNPLGILIEIAPAFGTDFVFQGGVGVRFRLK